MRFDLAPTIKRAMLRPAIFCWYWMPLSSVEEDIKTALSAREAAVHSLLPAKTASGTVRQS